MSKEERRIASRERAKKWGADHPERRREIMRKYRENNKDKVREVKRAWRKANPEKHNAANARWKMNRIMKICDFDAMLTKQEGLCAICRLPDPGRVGSERLTIDHDHVTGLVRGLLCHRCNTMLGMAKDDPATLEAAIAYLRKSTEGEPGDRMKTRIRRSEE